MNHEIMKEIEVAMYHKVREYFVFRDGHGLGSMDIHLAHHSFSFNIWWIINLVPRHFLFNFPMHVILVSGVF